MKPEQQLGSGQQITYGIRIPTTPLAAVASESTRERPRWRDGWLVYRNEPLQSVIEDISRYTDKQIAVSDEGASQLRFSGAVYRTDIEEWIHALPESFPVRVEQNGVHFMVRSR